MCVCVRVCVHKHTVCVCTNTHIYTYRTGAGGHDATRRLAPRCVLRSYGVGADGAEHARTRARAHTHAHTYIYTHTHTHTHTQGAYTTLAMCGFIRQNGQADAALTRLWDEKQRGELRGQ